MTGSIQFLMYPYQFLMYPSLPMSNWCSHGWMCGWIQWRAWIQWHAVLLNSDSRPSLGHRQRLKHGDRHCMFRLYVDHLLAATIWRASSSNRAGCQDRTRVVSAKEAKEEDALTSLPTVHTRCRCLSVTVHVHDSRGACPGASNIT